MLVYFKMCLIRKNLSLPFQVMPRQAPWIQFIRQYPSTPTLIRRIIICTDISYKDRALLAAFVVGNNINVPFFIRAIKSVRPSIPNNHLNKLYDVCLWLHRAFIVNDYQILNKYFYYDLTLKHTFYLSGREYISPARLNGFRQVTTCS